MDHNENAAGGSDQAVGNLPLEPDSDAFLIQQVRDGVAGAFDVLYTRHSAAAMYAARRHVDNVSDADDVVADAFASIYHTLQSGKGPDSFFRAYLLTIVRRTAFERNRKSSALLLTGDDENLDSARADDDVVLQEFESTAVAQAYRSLPERWQAVLWHVDIEGLKPAAAAPFVGLSPNGVSSLLIRAREGLRRAYLQNHLSTTAVGETCAEYAEQLGTFARGGLKQSVREKIQEHLDGCLRCTAMLADLNDVQASMRAGVFPLIAGIAFTPAIPAIFAGTATGAATSGAIIGTVAGKTVGLGALKVAVAGVAKAAVASPARITGLAATGAVAAAAVVGLAIWVAQAQPAPPMAAAGQSQQAPAPSQPVQSQPAQSSASTASPTAPPSSESAPTPSAPAPSSPAASVPAPKALAPSGVTVSGSGTVNSATSPAQAPAAPAPTQTVSASFQRVASAQPTSLTLNVTFALQGPGTPSDAQAVFTVPSNTLIDPASLGTPANWTCTVSPDQHQAQCATPQLDPSALGFALHVTVVDPAQVHQLSYSFAGTGVTRAAFANAF
ncbi:sigma-70 family RNA polymerase sigma factor [Psychromicrobium xiongbiense]|uniref:sigma-70 family RNA polymerase sigma factor n=1 Tax=Psychromicrobium xiongbiense TaxID=3051184 RepID=UPI0025554872|nr:sigma-70 family RNA polymerase sigma factor [Psychromicrobium sp. YIM S02556]